MNYWGILGIEPTKDKNKIKEAYRERLSVVNPEDDEEGFKKLREAFEILTKKADEKDIEGEEKEDTTSIGKWIKKVKKIYDTFSLRINEDSWKELLKDEVAFELDTMDEAKENILIFLMDNYRLPQKIWILLNNHFNFIENKEELYERFPREFIDYVENRIKYKDTLNYDLFEDIDDSKDYEEFLILYYKAKGLLNERKLDEVKETFQEIKKLGIYHPYVDELNVHYYIDLKDYNKAREYAEKIYNKYPEDERCIFAMAEVEWCSKNINEAEKLYDKILEKNPNHFDARCGKADCLFENNKLEEAREIYEGLLRLSYYNNYIREKIYMINEKTIDKLKSENSSELKDKFNLAWCLFDNNRYDEVLKLMEDEDITEEFENQYCDLMGKTYSALKDSKKAIEYFEKWERRLKEGLSDNRFLKEKDENSNELTIKEAMQQLTYVNGELGRNLYVLKRYDESVERYNKVLEKDENNITILNLKGLSLNKLKRYEESIGLYEKALSIDNSYVPLYINKAEALHELGYDGDALDDLEKGKEIYAYFPYIYELEMKIYCKHKEYKRVQEIYDEALSISVVNDGIKLQYGIMLSSINKDEEALKVFNEIIERINSNGDECNILSDCYYEISITLCNLEKYKEAWDYLNKGMELSEDKTNFVYLKAAILKANEKYDLAINEYKKIIEKFPNDSFAYVKIGEIYNTLKDYEVSVSWFTKASQLNKNDIDILNKIGNSYYNFGKYNLAIENYSKALEISEKCNVFINRGMANERLKNYEEALKDYEKASEIEPNNPEIYDNIGVIYEIKKDYEKAIMYYKKAINISSDGSDSELFYSHINRLLINTFRLDEALQYNQEAKSKFEDKYKYYNREVFIYKKQRNFHKALSICNEMIKEDNVYKAHWYKLMAECYFDLCKYDETIKYYKKILKITNKKNDFIYRDIASAYRNKKQYLKALYFIKKQLKYVKDDGINYLIYADILNDLKIKLAAHKNYKKALNLYLVYLQNCNKNEEDITSAYYNKIGRCYYGIGDYNNAIKYFNKGLNAEICITCQCNKCYNSFYYLGMAYESIGNLNEAYSYFKKAYDIAPYDNDNKEAFDKIKQKMNIN